MPGALVCRERRRWPQGGSMRAVLDPCPTPSWCPAGPEPSCSGGRSLGALEMERGGGWEGTEARRAVRWGAGGALGVRRGRAGARERGELHCGKGAAEDGRRSGWSAPGPASSVAAAGSEGAAWAPRGTARRRPGTAGSAGTSGSRLSVTRSGGASLFRIQHPQSRPAPPDMLRALLGTAWFC